MNRGALGAAVLATATTAAAQVNIPPEGVRHTVRAGETCLAIAQRYYGDRAHIGRLHEGNPALGAIPHHLRPGQVLLVLPLGSRAADPDARLSFLRNLVSAFTPDEHAGRRDEPLHRGHRVGTQALSSAEVTFRDESRVQMESHTLVVILGDDRGAVAPRAEASDTTLVRGTLRAHLAELLGAATPPAATGGAQGLATPAGRVQVDAGTAMVSVDAQRTTRLAVHRGRSRITAQRRTVAVPEGYGSRADVGRAPTPPRPLPAPPTWGSAPPSVLFAPGGHGLLSARFAQAPGASTPAARWRVQVARDARFNDLVVDETVDRSVDRLESRDLAAGDYFVRVAGIDGDQFEGIATEALAVHVVDAAPPPAAGEGAVDYTPPAGVFCAVDQGTFGDAVRFDRARAHTVRCAASADGARAVETVYPAVALAAVEVAPPAPRPAPVAPPRARPRETQRFTLRADLELAAPATSAQRDEERLGLGLGGSLRAGWSPTDAMTLQAGATVLSLERSLGERAQRAFAHVGLRIEPRVYGRLRVAGELEGGASLLDGVRPVLGAGVGVELGLGERWGVGLGARYRRTFADTAGEGVARDPGYFSAGVSVVWRSSARE